MTAAHAAPPAPLRTGHVVGDRYRIVREIGGGGMGYVFEAEHTRLQRSFALKVLRVGAVSDELVQRFEREARALAKVRTARVAQVTDFGVEAGVGPYYVMELVEGRTLDDRLHESGALPLALALRIGAEVARAVHDVHGAGIVHRDIKPGNIGLPSEGPVLAKLLDFGLAASIDDAFLTRITKSDQILGSLPYIAPEQFTGSRPTPSQDIWALGVVLFEMLTGRLPFDGPSTAAVMHQILTAPLPPIDAAPPAVRGLISRLLEKDPSKRVASAGLVAAELESLATIELPRTVEGRAYSSPPSAAERLEAASAPTAAHPASMAPRPIESGIRRRPLRAWVALVALATLIGMVATVSMLAWWARSRVAPAQPEPAPIAAPLPPTRSPIVAEPAVSPEVEAAAPAPTSEPATPPPPSRMSPRAAPMRPAPVEPAAMTEALAPAAPMAEPPSMWNGEIIR